MNPAETDTMVATMDPEPMAKEGPRDTPKTLFAIKGYPEWYDWLSRYAESRGMTATGVIDFALSEQAKRDKFPDPMPKRFGR